MVRARRMIEGIYPGGSTNLGGGLLEGDEQVRRHFIPGGINRVLLLSDGLANRGITSPDELSRIAVEEGSRPARPSWCSSSFSPSAWPGCWPIRPGMPTGPTSEWPNRPWRTMRK